MPNFPSNLAVKQSSAKPASIRFVGARLTNGQIAGTTRQSPVWFWAVCLAVLTGCGESPKAGQGKPAGDGGADHQVLTAMHRVQDSRVLTLRGLIADGWLEPAQELMAEVRDLPELGVERALLEARLALMAGDGLQSAALIEEARREDPSDPRVWATAAELAVAQGQAELAIEQVKAGIEKCGVRPELLRAQGILAIFQEGTGQGRRGLDFLERAHAADAALPFMDWPLSEAHRLFAQELAGTRLTEAIEHGEKALALAGENLDARELLAELYMSANRWGDGLELFESLLPDRPEIGPKYGMLCKNAGVLALTQNKKAVALEYFMRARELGLSEEELSTGAATLKRAALAFSQKAQEALDATDMESAENLVIEAEKFWDDLPEVCAARSDLEVRKGLIAFQKDEFDSAGEHFAAAVKADPDSLVARHLLGRNHMDSGRYAEAAKEWYRVVDDARAQGVSLPDPVHLGLARALALQDQLPAARSVLQNYLDFEPSGGFAEATRDMLKALEGH